MFGVSGLGFQLKAAATRRLLRALTEVVRVRGAVGFKLRALKDKSSPSCECGAGECVEAHRNSGPGLAPIKTLPQAMLKQPLSTQHIRSVLAQKLLQCSPAQPTGQLFFNFLFGRPGSPFQALNACSSSACWVYRVKGSLGPRGLRSLQTVSVSLSSRRSR